MWHELTFSTRAAVDFLEITRELAEDLRQSGVQDGVGYICVPHTTAGLTLNENADPDVLHDLKLALERMMPPTINFRHLEGNSLAHLQASLMGVSLILPVRAGRMLLGTWQGVYLCEFDGPRRRRILVRWAAQSGTE
ncbi:MAG: YjbQ family protein [Firmicutes bacterium]|nr:YjbQ family protein [Bacillota bacterium]